MLFVTYVIVFSEIGAFEICKPTEVVETLDCAGDSERTKLALLPPGTTVFFGSLLGIEGICRGNTGTSQGNPTNEPTEQINVFHTPPLNAWVIVGVIEKRRNRKNTQNRTFDFIHLETSGPIHTTIRHNNTRKKELNFVYFIEICGHLALKNTL